MYKPLVFARRMKVPKLQAINPALATMLTKTLTLNQGQLKAFENVLDSISYDPAVTKLRTIYPALVAISL